MAYSDIVLIVIGVSLIALVGIHLILSYAIGRESRFPTSLVWLAGLSVASTLLWIGVAVFVFYTFIVDCCYNQDRSPFYEIFFFRTLGAPLTSDGLCDLAPELEHLIGYTVCGIINLLLLPIGFYVLGLFGLLVKPRGKLVN
jgi:hypothetical protein